MEHKKLEDLTEGSGEPPTGELRRAFERIEKEVQEGVVHGYFDMTVSCEIISGKKRQLTIRSGKSYRHVIGPEELGS